MHFVFTRTNMKQTTSVHVENDNDNEVQARKVAELSSQCPECMHARAAGTLTSVARARDTRVRSLVELVFGTRLEPAQRSAARATQPWRRVGVHVLAAEQNRRGAECPDTKLI